ncbi:phage portal protein [Novosphingobium profundi]|uniref:phage portal protein n=1 Tax=Novosphingobium profundi TaxID=1774954 RepID=UPI001BDAF91C|nr:phage portal protein [Novosphingobium profundi]
MASFWPFGERKSRNYSKDERPQSRRSLGGLYSTGSLQSYWTDEQNFERRAKALLYKCPVSRRCFEIRSEKLASITLKVEGANKVAKKVLAQPNFRDRTISNLLRSTEVDLGIGGDVWLFLNQDVTVRPVLESLRSDFMFQEPSTNQIFYDPKKALTGTSKPELIFTMDPDDFGRTQTVERRIGDTNRYEVIDGALLQISIYNPLSSVQGSGAGDAILADVATYSAAMMLMHARFANGGRRAGWITLPDMGDATDMSDADWAELKRNLEKLRDDDELKGLVAGSTFIENQMTFTELDIVEVIKALERRIAMALGVQPVMLGFEGEASHANMRTADRTFYTGWLKPRADFILGHLQAFLAEELNCPNLSIAIDETKLPYLQDDRLEQVDKMAGRGAITFNEYREAMGWEAVEWGDKPIPVAGAGEAMASSSDKEPQQQPDNAKPREVGHDADTSRRADQRS